MNTIDAGSAKLAGLQIDTLSKYRAGQLTLEQWERFNNLSPEDREERFGDWKRPKPGPEKAQEPVVYLRRLHGTKSFPLPATDGLVKLKGSALFGNRVFGETLPDGQPTGQTAAMIYEQVVDGTWARVFGSLGDNRKRWQSEGQVLAFCSTYNSKLQTDGYATFFEMEGGFVVLVGFVDHSRLEVRVDLFSDGNVWRAKYRHLFVIPQ